MPQRMAQGLADVKAKGSAARFAPADLKGEKGRNFLALTDDQRAAGRYFQRAREIAGLTQGETAGRLQLDHSAVSRLESGLTVPPIIAAFLANPDLRVALLDAIARTPGDAAESRTVITIAHPADRQVVNA